VLGAPGVVHPETLPSGTRGQADPTRQPNRAEGGVDWPHLTGGEVAGDVVTTHVLPVTNRTRCTKKRAP
jgi:hypothetical protein